MLPAPRKFGFELKLPFEFLKRANLRGVLGNMASLGIVGLIAIIAVAVVSIWIPLGTACILIFAIVFLVGLVIFSIQKTLKDHPASPLEDQLYFEHRKIEMELAASAKHIAILPTIAPPMNDPHARTIEAVADVLKIAEPEEEE